MSRKPSRDSNESRIKQRERTAKTKAKYYGKLALAQEWEAFDKAHYQKLMNEAAKLYASLVVKGAL